MKIGVIGMGSTLVHAMVGVKTDQTVLIDDSKSLSITNYSPSPINTLTLIERHDPAIYFDGDQFRGKNKSKRKYPKPR